MRATTSLVRSPLGWVPLFLSVALLAVPLASSATSETRDGLQLRKVKIAIIATDATAQVMYAKHRGFFAKQGIDAEITVVGDGTLTVAAVLAGEAQFAGIPVGALAILKSRNAPVKAVAGGSVYDPNVPTTVLAAAPGKRITPGSRPRRQADRARQPEQHLARRPQALARAWRRLPGRRQHRHAAVLADDRASRTAASSTPPGFPSPGRPRRSSVAHGPSPIPSTPCAPRTAS